MNPTRNNDFRPRSRIWVRLDISSRFEPSPNIVLFDRAFLFVMGPMKSPNPGHAVGLNGFYKKTHCYTLFCGKMSIPYRNINKYTWTTWSFVLLKYCSIK